ncbi:MAG: bifunctional 4-hydroxy-2-oxoglutarate aldolase/2-dehydro-3-deoxy-phosphogluconate aldolase [Chitinophagaceae bacterium]|nr:MAG: bifunctional 4-hydroxy-2-oxoglutarate aldolase/2-dehydro-3-deoxy-phosphogluconate aldolase [Chitinophagaceae bacterium]
MNQKAFGWSQFNSMPVIGIMRNFKQSDIEKILPLYADSGLNTIEITMNSTGAEQSIQYVRENYGDKLNVGAGTVCTLQDLTNALQAGAQFIVTPIVNVEVIEECKKQSVPIFSGAYTPTEIFTAWNAGADMVKVFPMVGNAIEYIKAVRGPLPHIKLVPTGGVNLQNCGEFFAAGASGVGVGGQLFDNNLIKNNEWSSLADHFSLFAKKVKQIFL